jgi:hypothetical protein
VDNLEFREEPCAEDISRVARLLSRTQFFSAEEVEIGTSLVTERLSEGVRCGYLFLFAESKDAFLGYSCYGPIPGTLNGYDLYWIVNEKVSVVSCSLLRSRRSWSSEDNDCMLRHHQQPNINQPVYSMNETVSS